MIALLLLGVLAAASAYPLQNVDYTVGVTPGVSNNHDLLGFSWQLTGPYFDTHFSKVGGQTYGYPHGVSGHYYGYPMGVQTYSGYPTYNTVYVKEGAEVIPVHGYKTGVTGYSVPHGQGVGYKHGIHGYGVGTGYNTVSGSVLPTYPTYNVPYYGVEYGVGHHEGYGVGHHGSYGHGLKYDPVYQYFQKSILE